MIKNKEQLISHGFIKARKKAIKIIEACLKATDPYKKAIKQLKLIDNKLFFDNNIIDLLQYKNIYVVGAGKATYRLALAIEYILGDRITDGVISLKDDDVKPLKKIRITKGGHPFPNEASFFSGVEIEKITRRVQKSDLVFSLVTGGSSALCVVPVPGVPLEDKIEMNKLLVRSGADILEINTVRRHISRIKGGGLMPMVYPATVISLTVSDEKRDSDWNHDWTAPDESTFTEAVNILKKYKLWDNTPESIKNYLLKGDYNKETPKSIPVKQKVYFKMVVKTVDLWGAARDKAREIGLEPMLLTTVLTGDAFSAGRFFSAVAISALHNGLPVKPPCMIFATGETFVRLEKDKKFGLGGANQEIALSGCIDLKKDDNRIVICSVDSDGTDGPTNLAGGMTDYTTINRVKKAKKDFYELLFTHSCCELLETAGDAIITGTTGTNVNALTFVLVL